MHATAATTRNYPKRILVVDDDPAGCDLMAAVLESANYEVETAADGEAAWMALLGNGYDLMVTDHFMPKVSGLALARRIRVAHFPLLVVLASERLDASDTVNLSHDPWSRIDAFVHKPFTGFELLAAVSGLLSAGDSKSLPSDFAPRSDQTSYG